MSENPFPPTSRYFGLPVAEYTRRDGKPAAYLTRRFLPQPERFVLLYERTVSEGERLDLIAAAELGDPEQFWRIADANNAMYPDELTATPGARIRITLPEGVPEAEDA